MLSLAPKELENWSESFAKDGIVYKTDNGCLEATSNLVGLIDLLIEINKNQKEKPTSKDDDPRMYFIDKNGIKILL